MSVEESRPVLLEDAEVIRVEKEKRNKKIVVAVLTTVVTVGLCLGIALPLTLSTSNTKSTQLYSSSSGTEKNHSAHDHDVTHTPIVDFKHLVNDLFAGIKHGEKTTTTKSPGDKTTHHRHHHPTWPTIKPSDFCVPLNTSKVNINLKDWLPNNLIVAARIQTLGSPAFAHNVGCSTLNFTTGKGDSYDYIGGWEEGGLRPMSRCSKTFKGVMSTTEQKYHFNIDFTGPEQVKGYRGEWTMLMELEGYLLAYECYPESHGPFKRGYSIFFYRKDSDTPTDERVVRLLAAFANRLGINPFDNELEFIPHLCLGAPKCEIDSGEDESQ